MSYRYAVFDFDRFLKLRQKSVESQRHAFGRMMHQASPATYLFTGGGNWTDLWFRACIWIPVQAMYDGPNK